MLRGSLRKKSSSRLGTEMATYRALQRRGLAYDLVGLLSVKVRERWLQKAYARMSDPPIPGYCPTTLQQILRADRALWELAQKQAKLTRSAPQRADHNSQVPGCRV